MDPSRAPPEARRGDEWGNLAHHHRKVPKAELQWPWVRSAHALSSKNFPAFLDRVSSQFGSRFNGTRRFPGLTPVDEPPIESRSSRAPMTKRVTSDSAKKVFCRAGKTCGQHAPHGSRDASSFNRTRELSAEVLDSHVRVRKSTARDAKRRGSAPIRKS